MILFVKNENSYTIKLFHTADGKHYLEKHALRQHMPNATHIVWATGGSMVPPDVMEAYYKKGVN